MSEADSGAHARLISPTYNSNYSKNACFKIFYNMYGLSPGNLRVYSKPISVELEDALANSSYMAFEVKGNQGNKWNEQIFNLPQYNEEFQLVIEGISTLMFASHIAVDDVALLNNEECKIPIENASEEDGGIWALESCVGRCDEAGSTLAGSNLTFGADGKITKKCDCFVGCAALESCCPDFLAVCTAGKTYLPRLL